MFRIILAAVDSSARAPMVVKAAAAVAEKFDGQVHLFRVLTLPPDIPAAARTVPDDLAELLVRHAEEQLVALADGHARVVVERPELGTREPWRAIIDEAVRLGAELIVIGSHGYGGWDRILGTVAGKVTNHADRAVLVVHSPQLEAHR